MEMKILTVDVEDWYHLLDYPKTSTQHNWSKFTPRIHENFERVIQTIQRYNYKATFFCLGWVAEQYPDIIKEICRLGYEVATHSHMHQLVYQQTPDQFRDDLKKSINILEEITGKKIITYRAPGFSFIKGNPWAFEALVELGIQRDSSIFGYKRAHGGYADLGLSEPFRINCNGGQLKEFPIIPGKFFGRNVIFSGGGYFRLLPYNIIQRLTANSEYVMSYFHPRDFDPEQPILDLSYFRRFKSYVGLKTAYDKFERWLDDNQFIDIDDADKMVDWKTTDILEIHS